MSKDILEQANSDFWLGFYEPDAKTPPGQPISLEQRVGAVATLMYGSLGEEIERKELERIVRQAFFDSLMPSPDGKYDPVQKPAIELMAKALMRGMPVYIWTIGDTGLASTNDDRLDPSENTQLLKIERGQIVERLEALAGKEKLHNLHIDTCAEGKESSLRSILLRARELDIEDVYVADDKDENGLIVEKLRTEFPELNIHFFLIKEDWDHLGNVEAYKNFMFKVFEMTDDAKNKLSFNKNDTESKCDSIVNKMAKDEKDKPKMMLVLDLDNVIIKTTASLERTARLIGQELLRRMGNAY